MLKAMRERLSRDEGFTLIELMVVVLIIAVLVAIAIPSFLGFRNSAQDRAAQTALRNTLLAEKGVWTDTESYTTSSTALQNFEASVDLGTGSNQVNIIYMDADNLCMESESASGNVFGIFQNSGSPTEFASGAAAGDLCQASAPSQKVTANWQTGSFPQVP